MEREILKLKLQIEEKQKLIDYFTEIIRQKDQALLTAQKVIDELGDK